MTHANSAECPVPEALDRIATQVVDAAFRVHSALGPGLLENVYEACMGYELRRRGLDVVAQVPMPVIYCDLRMDIGYRIDLLVERSIVVELKAVESILPVHTAQVLTYLKLSNCRLGFLVNFNVDLIKKGIKRIAL